MLRATAASATAYERKARRGFAMEGMFRGVDLHRLLPSARESKHGVLPFEEIADLARASKVLSQEWLQLCE